MKRFRVIEDAAVTCIERRLDSGERPTYLGRWTTVLLMLSPEDTDVDALAAKIVELLNASDWGDRR